MFAFNHGLLKLDGTSGDHITSNTMFRILSTSKNFAAYSALVVERESRSLAAATPLTLDTPVRLLLPNFRLPQADWDNGGSEITLAMLGSHSSGLPREGYSTDFNMVTALAKVTAQGIGAEWAEVTPENILDYLNTTHLMFGPGQRAACKPTYSPELDLVPSSIMPLKLTLRQIPTLVSPFLAVSGTVSPPPPKSPWIMSADDTLRCREQLPQ